MKDENFAFPFQLISSYVFLTIIFILNQGGNDHEIYEDPRTIGHKVANPDDTVKQLRELFFS